MPRFWCSRLRKLCSSRLAPESSTTLMPICAATRNRLSRACELDLVCLATNLVTFGFCSAGTMPKVAAQSSARSTVNRMMRASSCACARNGRPVGAMATNTRKRISASRQPAAAPAIARSNASVSVCRMSRLRLAPSAERTASSSLPGKAAGGKQTGHVGAGDQQHCKHRAEKHPGNPVCLLHLAVADGTNLQMEVLADFLGDPLLCVLIQRLQLVACLLHAHAGFEPGKGPHGKANAAINRVLRGDIHLSGYYDIGRAAAWASQSSEEERR